ncbi:MAG: UDP-N-acetylmuramoyl-L-alanine--D-glutamate ligase [Candidatus Portnoybacteria bacterium]|nr:UDP-N-acetylmuramoyl-L-alanine--D-glutamate ligase [Candidatus Portnoybacteria bacterium]
MNIDSFKNKKVTVMGIGLHGGGTGVIKFLAGQGAKILATDLRTEKELAPSMEKLKGLPVKYVLGEHRLEDFTEAELIIKNPAVPEDNKFLAAARDKKIPIESDIGIFLELCPAPIIGITGTKGKSTSAALLAHVLSQHYKQVILAGNIRQSVLEKLPEITKDTVVVLELSSWQLADAKNHKKSPYVAVITNIMPDHLNRYPSFQAYAEDKKLIFKFQKDKDYLFLNFADPMLRQIAKEASSRIYFYSADGDALLKEDLPKFNQKARLGAYVKNRKIYYGAEGHEICSLKDLKIIGEHNFNNALAAVSVADLHNVPREKIKMGLKTFRGLPGRLEAVEEINGVKYINDTTATAPDAAIASLKAVQEHYFDGAKEAKEKHIILIAGGADKDLNFSEFGKAISGLCKAVVLLEGEGTNATPKIIAELALALKKETAADMEQAVAIAAKLAGQKEIVLLSPGCASFGLFQHEFDRGDKFNQAVKKLKKIPKSRLKSK